MTEPGHIDVHHHFVPSFYWEAARRAGVTMSGGAPMPDWRPEDTLAMLDERGVAAALLSVVPPGVYFGDQAQASVLARRCNEFAAGLVGDHPDRLGAFAVLPLPDVDAALTEVGYALDVLGLDGVGLYSNVAGRYLGDPRFEPLFAELDRRGAVVYLHPAEPPCDPAPGLSLPPWFGEFVFDTTRALTNMVLRGTLERNARFTLIVAHAGGTAPYIVNRMTNAWRDMPEARLAAPEEPLAYLRRLYYDTASCGAGHSLRLLRDLVGADRLLVGSDFPFVPAHAVSVLRTRLEDPHFLGVPAEFLRASALRVFPRFGLVVAEGNEPLVTAAAPR